MTYVAVIREAEAVQLRYTEVSAPVLHPCIRPHLAAQLLVHRARVPGLGELVRHGAAEDEPPAGALRLHLDGHTHVEAAPDPLVLRIDVAGVPIAEPQMVPDKSRDRLSAVSEHLGELLRGREIRYLADDMRVLLKRRLERDGSPVVQLEGGGHGLRNSLLLDHIIVHKWPGVPPLWSVTVNVQERTGWHGKEQSKL
jgi:hypothetical protein